MAIDHHMNLQQWRTWIEEFKLRWNSDQVAKSLDDFAALIC